MLHIFRLTGGAFVKYLKESKALFCLLYALLCFGFVLTHYSLTIDEETWIQNTDPARIRLWLQQGRFGLYAFNALFSPLGRFVPFVWDFAAVTLWAVAGVILSFFLTMASGGYTRFSVLAFGCLFCGVPLAVGELLSFSMFNLQLSLAMAAAALSVGAVFLFFQYQKISLLAAGAFLLFVSTSFFQAFPNLFICAMAAYAAIRACFDPAFDLKRLTGDIGVSVGVFGAGTGLYCLVNLYVTTRLAPGGAAYLQEGFIGWDDAGWLDALMRTVRNNRDLLLGRGIVGGGAMRLTALMFAACLLLAAAQKKKARNKLLALVFCALMLVSPFALSLALAMPNIVGRTYLALPFACGAAAFVLLNAAARLRRFYRLSSLLVLAILIGNMAAMNRYFYQSHLAYQRDRAFAQSVMAAVERAGIDWRQRPIALIGRYESGAQTENWGPAVGSFFCWDEGNIVRMTDFLKAEGYPVLRPTAEQIGAALSRSYDMPDWPHSGSVAQLGDLVIVKLSAVEEGSVWLRVNGAG
jgi:hypothetical protein